jgi:hypothetical protein
MIVRGTTSNQNFIVPMSSTDIVNFYVTYMQNNEVVLDKGKDTEGVTLVDNSENTESDSSKITVHLTQEDTLKFKFYPAAERNIAVVQIRLTDSNGEAYASEPIHKRIFGVLKDGII